MASVSNSWHRAKQCMTSAWYVVQTTWAKSGFESESSSCWKQLLLCWHLWNANQCMTACPWPVQYVAFCADNRQSLLQLRSKSVLRIKIKIKQRYRPSACPDDLKIQDQGIGSIPGSLSGTGWGWPVSETSGTVPISASMTIWSKSLPVLVGNTRVCNME